MTEWKRSSMPLPDVIWHRCVPRPAARVAAGLHDHGPAAGGCQLGAGQGEPCRGFALVLFTLGIYGLLANSVAGRMREMGIRMALGSTSRASGGDRHRARGDLGYQRGDGWLGAGIVIRAPV